MSFFSKKNVPRKKYKHAKYLLRHSKKVFAYRRDVLTTKQLEKLLKAHEALDLALKEEDIASLEKTMCHLEDVLREVGGKLYPVTFWSDNVEVLLVASILAIGIRMFFFQPFQIPTPSMYPTYSGMTTEVYHTASKEKSLWHQAYAKLVLGSTHYETLAKTSGRVDIPLFAQNDRMRGMGLVRFEVVQGRKWLGLLPSIKRRYTFYVNGVEHPIEVPFEFSLDDVVLKTFYPQVKDYETLLQSLDPSQYRLLMGAHPKLVSAVVFKEGDYLFNFDILSGDMLFVNRFSYHFVKPKVGDPIVFKTINIANMRNWDGTPEDKYYIKRLVGLPGDVLSVAEPVLLRNQKPIEGASPFEKNAKRIDGYEGYFAVQLLGPGQSYRVPDHTIFAMGDNSGHSWDSRYWGPVPERELVGKAAFIFYPFTQRFGLAK